LADVPETIKKLFITAFEIPPRAPAAPDAAAKKALFPALR
jgi:hypothetical protein